VAEYRADNNFMGVTIMATKKTGKGLSTPVQPDKILGSIVGTKAMPRTEIVKKLWDSGVRNFVRVGRSLVYHFGRISTGRIKNYCQHATNRDSKFLENFKITLEEFMTKDLKRGKSF
jgi:hypothetical protein